MINTISSQFLPAINWVNLSNSNNLDKNNNNFYDLFTSLTDNNTIKKANGKNGTESNIFNFTQQILMNIENELESFGAGSTTTTNSISDINSVDTANSSYFESILSNSGPLPAFMHEMDIRLHLTPTQSQELRDIAAENMNATKTPESIQKIAMELQRAGIG